MKTGQVIKSITNEISDEEMALVNQYARRPLTKDEVYIFSVVLCDNDIDRDFERFTVESLFELEKLFVGKTGIFDHHSSAFNQTARVISAKVEAVSDRKTETGDEYFRLVCRAYIPYTEKTKDIIDAIDSGIIKEVSVGCAVKHTLCSVCNNDIYSTQCHHTKGEKYSDKLCYGQLCGVYDAYEFSFVAVPAQKNAGVIKTFSKTKRENENMKDIICQLKKGKQMTLDNSCAKSLYDYITELEKQALDGEFYRHQLKAQVCKHLGATFECLSMDTINSITEKMTVSELKEFCESFEHKSEKALGVQLSYDKNTQKNHKTLSNQFTI